MKVLTYAHSFEVPCQLPEALLPLRELAMNFRWAWDHETKNLFREIDPEIWSATRHNPAELLSLLSEERKNELATDELFLTKLRIARESLQTYLSEKTWFDEHYPGMRDQVKFAYFCAEFGISECLPIYSGGLGILAGDHLKSASDLGLPLVAVGLLYQHGYFRQSLTWDGWQQELYPDYDFYRMPLELVRGDDLQPLTVSVDFPDRAVTCQIWKASVGTVELYLLDSNILANSNSDQDITDTLYGGDEHIRIRQEMILGIGGMRALKAMGVRPTVCHMNEGHAAFLTIERIRQLKEEFGCDFALARQLTVASNVFTTHTPVPAGFDVFPVEMMKSYLSKEVEQMGLPFDDFLNYGKLGSNDTGNRFNMAMLAMNNASNINGVAKLHAEISRSMFTEKWPDFPLSEIPIEAVTNGIHVPTWISRKMFNMISRHSEDNWIRKTDDPKVWEQAVDSISDAELWDLREDLRGDLVRFCRKSSAKASSKRQASRVEITQSNAVLDPRLLTIGFARRFATYKRATLLFQDRDRLLSLIHHAERPVQFIFAGKAHPRDDAGKKLIQDIFQFIQTEGVGHRMVFVEDYDMEVARYLVQGVDVWLNNPKRPLEASGTSGMKVLANGGLNCSVLDGWWDEGYNDDVGWAIGGHESHTDDDAGTWMDSRALYRLIEQEIAPLFYQRNDQGIPVNWLEKVRESMKQLSPAFSTQRMVADYATRFYTAGSSRFLNLSKDDCSEGRSVVEWQNRVSAAWSKVAIESATDNAGQENRLKTELEITITANLDGLCPDDVAVEVVTGRVVRNRELAGTQVISASYSQQLGNGRHQYKCVLPLLEPGYRGYVCRIIPKNADIVCDAELGLRCWQASSS